VQNAQRDALIDMDEKHLGHSFVVGSSGGASSSLLSLLRPRISIKTAKATIKKLITVLKNMP
jgi:hypothetical protein